MIANKAKTDVQRNLEPVNKSVAFPFLRLINCRSPNFPKTKVTSRLNMPGNYTSLFCKLPLLLTNLFMITIALLFQITAAGAHELRPAIMDVGILEDVPGQLTINLTFSGEAFLAEIDLSAVSNTDDSSGSKTYDELRAVPPHILEDRLKSSFATLAEKFTIMSANRPLTLELVEIDVAEEADSRLARDTQLKLKSSLPKSDEAISIQWQPSMGALLIRQMGRGSDPEYSDYLPEGGTSQAFLINNADSIPLRAVIGKYVQSGVIHIVPAGLDHILFVVGLLAYGLSARGLVFQISLFTVAHTITLAAASLGWLYIPSSIVEPLIALSIAWIGIENIVKKSHRVARTRSFVVFTFGLLHGLGFASVLADFGLPQSAFIVGLLSFNIGVEIGQLIIVVPIFFLLRAFRLTDPQFRRAFQIPVSAVISAIGVFWFIERVGFL